jgi:LEA14-like dessication related protein
MYILCRIVVSLLAISLAACAGIRPEPPEVQLSALEITDFSLSHANFLATLRLFNPNGTALDVKGIKFTLFLNDVRIAKGQTAKTFTLPAEESGEAVIRLSSSFLDLLQLTRKLQDRSEITFRIAGEVRIGGYGLLGATIPIEREGALPLSGSLNQLLPGTGQMLPLKQLGDPVLSQ